jgi:hypothetical protein
MTLKASATDYALLNRTCARGMARATSDPYRHILELLDERCSERARTT